MGKDSHPRRFLSRTTPLRLEYFVEYPLGHTARRRAKHVPLAPGKVRNLKDRQQFFNNDNFCWKVAKQLEGREDSSAMEGVWPINHWRAQRRLGTPGSDVFPTSAQLRHASSDVYAQAREMRLLSYFRVRSGADAIRAVRSNFEVRLSVNLTAGWYDPPEGRIPFERGAPTLGAHNVPLVDYNDIEQRFVFPNSWGQAWGHKGWGALTLESFNEQANEAWIVAPAGLFPPKPQFSGPVCREWKWSMTSGDGVHCREVIDGDTTERLAWAFCVRRNGLLEIDDFYVWPSERGKGYGRVLADMVNRLKADMGVPIRMLVSCADSNAEQRDGVEAIASWLRLRLVSTDDWDVPLIGDATALSTAPKREEPERPAFLLELLRPKDESPAECPFNEVVFGTNRSPQDHANLSAGFSNTTGAALHIGMASVEVGKVPAFGSVGRAWRAAIAGRCAQRPRLRVLTAPNDIAAEAPRVQKPYTPSPFSLLFVHGFNVDFATAVEHGGRLGAELSVPGTTFTFSWPASANYLADSQAVEAAVPYFAEFLTRIIDYIAPQPLAIVAHSMGNRLLLRHLVETTCTSPASLSAVSQVVFAAPDVDQHTFTQAMADLSNSPFHKTLYMARGDIALQASEWLHGGPRAGLAPPVITAQGLDTILVEGGPLLNLGHAYYGDQSDVLHDLFVLLHYSSHPSGRRSLTQTATTDGRLYWKLLI